ncbi:MAG: hypothetical protein ACYDBW_00560 [Sulfuricaulis sp.]
MTDLSDSPVTKPHLTLYVPGLFSAWQNDDREGMAYPALETMLARAERHAAVPPSGYEGGLFALFDLNPGKDADLPVAAVTRMMDMGVIDNDWWLRADPVHLNLERDRLILIDAHRLDIAHNEAQGLVTEIMDVFAADGWLLKAPCANRWYLKPARAPDMTTSALSQVAGRDIHPFLPRGPDGKNWHTTLNEIQILLHAATVNEEREQRGQPAINSLWFWGGGRLPRIAPVSWTRVWSDEPVSQSLAKLSGTPCAGGVAGFTQWQRQVNEPGKYLVVLDEAYFASLYSEASQWRDNLKRLEQGWLVPLLQALKSGDVAGVNLVSDCGNRFSLTARQARRWWRFRRPLAAYCEAGN